MDGNHDGQLPYEPIKPKKHPLWYKIVAILSASALFLLSVRAYFYVADWLTK